MARIVIPGDALAEVIGMLKDIRDRIDRTASLSSVGSDQDVGDSGLIDAVNGFDAAWKSGQERVQENADTFRKTVEEILNSFQDTDDQSVGHLD
jgi:hypothetical protein